MSAVVKEEIKHWTARRKSALVLEIIQGKTTAPEASRQLDSHCNRLMRSNGLKQAFIAPHYPQRGGMARWIIRTLKEQCAN